MTDDTVGAGMRVYTYIHFAFRGGAHIVCRLARLSLLAQWAWLYEWVSVAVLALFFSRSFACSWKRRPK